jgi:hypothetical protein
LLAALSLADGTARAASADQPEKVVQKDDLGRVLRVEEAKDVTDFSYDKSGRLVFKQSERFGFTELTYAPGKALGPFGRVRAMKHSTPLGDWERQFIYDGAGQLALQVDGADDELLSRAVDRLTPYLWPKGLGTKSLEALDPIQGDSFASITVIEEEGVEVQRTSVFGREMEVTTRSMGEGRLEIRDDRGGKRTEVWYGGTLLKAYDEQGPILETTLDALGRPQSVILGGNTVLRYVFDGNGKSWLEKRLANQADELEIGAWKRADDFEDLHDARLPRRTVVAFLPGSAPIAEWDDSALRDGVIQVTRRGLPYALIPFDDGEELWHSISTSFDGIVTQDRIDYTDTQIRIYVSLGKASIAAGSEAVVRIDRARRTQPSGMEVER